MTLLTITFNVRIFYIEEKPNPRTVVEQGPSSLYFCIIKNILLKTYSAFFFLPYDMIQYFFTAKYEKYDYTHKV